jgi:hypothetical protein
LSKSGPEDRPWEVALGGGRSRYFTSEGNAKAFVAKGKWDAVPPPGMDFPGERSGLEGPFTYRSGWKGYYDPKEGRYLGTDDVYMPRDFDPETGMSSGQERGGKGVDRSPAELRAQADALAAAASRVDVRGAARKRGRVKQEELYKRIAKLRAEADRLEKRGLREAAVVGRGGVTWDPRLHPRNRMGEFRSVLGALGIGKKIKIPGATITRTEHGYSYVPDNGGMLGGPTFKSVDALASHVERFDKPHTPSAPMSTPHEQVRFDQDSKLWVVMQHGKVQGEGFRTREQAQSEMDKLRRKRLRLRPLQEGEVEHLEEVESAAYPGLDRSAKENWVDKAGGLPSYIERIAKHLHYEKGMTIGHAIATAVNTVKRWCQGGTVSKTGGAEGSHGVSAKTKAQACAAVAAWEKKKGGAKIKEAEWDDGEIGWALVLMREARADGSRAYMPSIREAGLILEWVEVMEAEERRLNEGVAHSIAAGAGHGIRRARWNPNLHPRNRQGEFRDVLAKLTSGTGSRGGGLHGPKRRDGMSAGKLSRAERAAKGLPDLGKGMEFPGTMEMHSETSPDFYKDMSLSAIAAHIDDEWSGQGKGVNFAARPYLDAMRTLNSIHDNYYADSGNSVVAYFLSNATSFRGEKAKAIKAELKRRLKHGDRPGSGMSRRSGHDLLIEALLDRLDESFEKRIAAHEAKDSTAFAEADRIYAATTAKLAEALPAMKKCKECGLMGKPGGKCPKGHKIGGD